MRKKDYNKISFKNKAIDRIGNGGGEDSGPAQATSLYKFSSKSKTKGGKTKERSKSRSQVNVTYIDSGKVFHEKHKSRTNPRGGKGHKTVTKSSGKQREKTLTKRKTGRLRNKFSMGKTIKP